MPPLLIDWIASAALACWLGWAGPKSLKAALGFCLLIAVTAWAASYLIMLVSPSLGGGTALAEDYINGFGVRTGAAEVAVALGWTFLWFAVGRTALLVSERARNRAS